MNHPPAAVVAEYWRLMASNDFAAVSAVLAPEFVLEWPQSRERIRGPANYARMNLEYPSQSRDWRFQIHRLIADGNQVTTLVSVTDGQQGGDAISFFTVVDGKITHLLEYWPEPFPAAEHRRHLTERMD